MKKKYLTQALENYDKEKGYRRHLFGDTAHITKLREIHQKLMDVKEEDELAPSIVKNIKDIYKKMEQGSQTSATHKTLSTLRNQIPLSELKSKFQEQQSIISQVARRAEYDAKHQSEINLEALQMKEKSDFQVLTNPPGIDLPFQSNLAFTQFSHGVPIPSLINTSYVRFLYLENARKELLLIQDKIERSKTKGVPDIEIEKFISKKDMKETWGMLLEQYKMCANDLLKMIPYVMATNTEAVQQKAIRQTLSFSELLSADLPKIYHLISQLNKEDVPLKNNRDLEEIKAILKTAVDKLNTYEKIELKSKRKT